jgi:hypothetical protein
MMKTPSLMTISKKARSTENGGEQNYSPDVYENIIKLN